MKPNKITGLVYPRCCPKVKEQIKAITVILNNAAPFKSKLSTFDETSLGKFFVAQKKVNTPIGRFIRKIYFQLTKDIIKPPSGGPTIVPKTTKVPETPKALPLSLLGNT